MGNAETGVLLEQNSDGNTIQGNFIGVDAAGSVCIVIVGEIGRDEEQCVVVEQRLNDIGSCDRIDRAGEHGQYGYVGSHQLEERELDLQGMLAAMHFRALGDQGTLQRSDNC